MAVASNELSNQAQEGKADDETSGRFVNETIVRAAAGMTMVLGAVAFALALLSKQYVPIRAVTFFFFVEFSIRVAFGIRYSPLGILSNVLFGRFKRELVSGAPKRFAWSIGIVMSLAMTVITNMKITGALPMTICVLCLTLMWLESAVGYCLGCHLYSVLVRRGVLQRRDDYEVCSNGECQIPQAK